MEKPAFCICENKAADPCGENNVADQSCAELFDQRLSFRYIDSTILLIKQPCPYNEDPLTPHFHTVKLGFKGVYSFFLLLL